MPISMIKCSRKNKFYVRIFDKWLRMYVDDIYKHVSTFNDCAKYNECHLVTINFVEEQTKMIVSSMLYDWTVISKLDCNHKNYISFRFYLSSRMALFGRRPSTAHSQRHLADLKVAYSSSPKEFMCKNIRP